MIDTVTIHCHSVGVSNRWTLDELVAEVATRLAGVEQDSGRVRDVPDQRTVRYYTTLGLVDGPEDRSGKLGLYGERQLLQVLAIKRLQSRGDTLATIQSKLMGLSTTRLRSIADADEERRPPERAPVEASLPVMQGVVVNNSVTVMLQLRRSLTEGDVAAIEAASAPLLRLLRSRRLVGS